MNKISYYTLLLLILCLTACENTDKLQADLDSLGNRIAALENKVELLNGNIKALNILSRDGLIISKVEHNATDGIYTLTLSDGTTLKLAEKVDGFGTTPLVSIDKDGFWQVSYDNANSFTPILKDGAPVKAVAQDGVTPAFRIGVNNYWEISVDGGKTYATVKNVDGNPVVAIYDPETAPGQFFESVTAKTDYLEVKLSNGETVRVPIVADFFCYFDAAITGEQKINPGETKTYNVHIKGADNTMIATPMGWKATLGAPINDIAVLTLIAPAAATASRAVADNTRDVSILALKGAFATLTKIQVNPIEVGGGSVTPPVAGPVTELIVPLTASTAITPAGKYTSANQIRSEVDLWFQRDAAPFFTTLSFDATEVALKAVVAAAKGNWNNASFGFHSASTFEWKAKYKLTFQVKTNVVGSVGVAIRTADDSRGFRMIQSDGTTNWERNVTTPGTKTAWEEVAINFDFGYASTAMSSTVATYNAGETPTTQADVEGINIYLYNNKENTTLYVKDLKLTKI